MLQQAHIDGGDGSAGWNKQAPVDVNSSSWGYKPISTYSEAGSGPSTATMLNGFVQLGQMHWPVYGDVSGNGLSSNMHDRWVDGGVDTRNLFGPDQTRINNPNVDQYQGHQQWQNFHPECSNSLAMYHRQVQERQRSSIESYASGFGQGNNLTGYSPLLVERQIDHTSTDFGIEGSGDPSAEVDLTRATIQPQRRDRGSGTMNGEGNVAVNKIRSDSINWKVSFCGMDTGRRHLANKR